MQTNTFLLPQDVAHSLVKFQTTTTVQIVDELVKVNDLVLSQI